MDIMIGRYSRGRGDLTSNVSFSREHLGKEDRKRFNVEDRFGNT